MASVSKIAQYYSAFQTRIQSGFMCARQGALSFISIPVPIHHDLNKICCCQPLLCARFSSPRREPWGCFLTFECSFLLPICRRTKPHCQCNERVHFTSSLTLCVFTWQIRLSLPAELSNLLLLPLLSCVCRGANQVDFCLSVQESWRGLALPARKLWEYWHNHAETTALSAVNEAQKGKQVMQKMLFENYKGKLINKLQQICAHSEVLCFKY